MYEWTIDNSGSREHVGALIGRPYCADVVGTWRAANGERGERRRWRIQRPERVAAVGR